MSDIHLSGTRFTVICKRCKEKFEVIRNWGGGIRRQSGGIPSGYNNSNPAKCDCGSRQLELF